MRPFPDNSAHNPSPSYITGMGTINCTGFSPRTLWECVQNGNTGIKNGLGRIPEEFFNFIQSSLLESPYRRCVPDLYQDFRSNKFYICSLFAIHQALQQAGWDRLNSDDCLLLATTTGQIHLWENSLADYSLGNTKIEEMMSSFREVPFGNTLDKLLGLMKAKCQGFVLSSACNASTQAIYLAHLFIKENRFKRCLVGGTELLNDLVVNGFKSLQLLSDTLATPFSHHRKGINLSEGSAFLCIEKEPQSKPIAVLAGGSFVSESFHMTSPDPNGKGYYLAMNQALKDSGLSPSDISWIHAHGTGSPQNDLSEANAIQRLFLESSPWVSSTKAIHGHMLGASGVLESIICLFSISENMIPQSAGYKKKDSEIRVPISEKSTPNQNQYVLKNTAGFGGNNSSLVFARI